MTQKQSAQNELGIITEAWSKTLEILKSKIPAPSFDSFLKKSYPISMSGYKVTVALPNIIAKGIIEERYATVINESFSSLLGSKVEVIFKYIEAQKETNPEKNTQKPKKKTQKSKDSFETISQPLNKSYTFNNFIVGPTNRFAHACCISVADDLGHTYNPLFIYGGSGLGKTHLMSAIGHLVSSQDPEKRIVYISGETFTYHYVTALREHKADDFRRKYRNIDLWLVDDIQFLAGKDRTEEEFFYTYNSIYDEGKQIVLTSDKAPKDLHMDNRLLSRFEMGLITSVSPPDLETRMAILQGKARAENMQLNNEVILYIAKLATKNIRQLEGALVKLHAYTSVFNDEITVQTAEDLLGEYFHVQNEVCNLDIDRIVKTVAKYFDVQESDIMGSNRSKNIVVPRQISMYLVRELMSLSLPTIGKAFGGKDHTTVLHGCKKIDEMMKTEKETERAITEIKEKLTCGKDVDEISG